MKQIDQALQKIELGKKAFDEAEQILAEILKGDSVPSVIEQEPVSEPIETRMEEAGFQFEDKTPPRTDLVCPLCSSKVYDNRPNKRSGQYKETAPDFTCSNIDDCSGVVQGDVRKLRKSWWLNSKDIPQDWINTTVPHNPEADYVDTTKNNNQEEEKSSPF